MYIWEAITAFSRLFSYDHASVNKEISFQGPQHNVLQGRDFPDPCVTRYQNTIYVFGTNDYSGHAVPVTSNYNFNNPSGWSEPADTFPLENVPAFRNWALPGTLWAPDVNELIDGDGSFIMYYSAATHQNPAIHCLGAARSPMITGPYNDSSTGPWICPDHLGGAIDASGFLDDDNLRYVLYKIDGPAASNGGYCADRSRGPEYRTSIMLVPVANDGYTILAEPISIYDNAGVQDGWNIEAPKLIKSAEGVYFLFFSSGCYSDDTYSQSYITSRNIRGPYRRRKRLLETGDYGHFGPGGADITASPPWRMVYHSLSRSGTIAAGRMLNTATLALERDTATLL